jgi:hypothetical protein
MLEQAFWGRCPVERAAAFSIYNRGSRIRRLVTSLSIQGERTSAFGWGPCMDPSWLKAGSLTGWI